VALSTETPGRVRTEFWPMTDGEPDRVTAFVEVERDDEGRVAIHTFVDDRDSVTSYYLSREDAIGLAHDVLRAVDLRSA
jgi:hypothetical protein